MPEIVPAGQHDPSIADLHAVTDGFEQLGSVNGLRIVTHDGRQLYENRMAGNEWLRPPRATALLAREQPPEMPDPEVVQPAMPWETLSRALAHDPGVPRDVVSQVLNWRSDAVQRCEGSEASAQRLQWACEAEAFREMDRFVFEETFPHHARAAALLGVAVIEAEKFEAPESTRYVEAARENIARRIERGDMTRIARVAAARAQRQSSPPRPKQR